jgi:DNA-binding transcriptional MerR regulator
MLRHYDSIGLLEPDRIEASTGYRSYSPDQLHVLNRIVALKDLGFPLEQVARLLDDDMNPAELRGMLRLRRAQLEKESRAIDTRLTAVETRLQMIEMESTMSADYVVKSIDARRLIAVTAILDPEHLADHIGPMFDEVASALNHARGALDVPIATYAETEAGTDVVVGYSNPGPPPAGTEIVELPEVTAVCGVHLGPMAGINASWQNLHRWIIDNGYTFAGPCRELYIRAVSEDQADWVTELQQPVTKS